MDTEWTLTCVCTQTIYTVDKPLFRLGRHREHDIICSSVVISREHAHFILKNKKLYVKDLRSANGTYINGERIGGEKEQILQNGDIVAFGYANHTDPCSPHGCFVYEVKNMLNNNSTADIIDLLEESDVSIQSVKDEPKLDVSLIKMEDTVIKSNNITSPSYLEWKNIKDISILKENIADEKPSLAEPASNLNDVAVKIENKVIAEKTNNEGSYSIEDNIIIIDDDIEDNNELSSSQLFPSNDPYLKIKEELNEYDYVNQRLPVIIDSDEG
ncbi:hypothetical protein AMK59_1090, partial [Oryctes borbonicus]